MVELIAAQRVAVALAEAKGLDPDHPRHLTRSVVLTDERDATPKETDDPEGHAPS